MQTKDIEIPAMGVDDLIDDRALSKHGDDAFEAVHVVDELEGLCRVAHTPANIALYAPWGSGKSSVSNLLEQRFRAKGDKVAFAKFDALKYTEDPFRRHFIKQLASAFEIKESQFDSELYSEENTTTLIFEWTRLKKLVGFLALTLVVLLVLAAGIGAIEYAAKDGDWKWSGYGRQLTDGLTSLFVSASIVVALFGLAAKAFEASTKRTKPSSAEEFERLFCELVPIILKQHDADRLVVFIDELDRCSPRQITSTLETLRTFLEVQKCVFIVGADQHVLETALGEAARQATPNNASTPYYSTATAYLDKIFNFQVSLPPMQSRRLTGFAADLVDDRGGIWQLLPNRREVVSVLVPTHVRSPRRVKALLNRFALRYRLSLKREKAGLVRGPIADRALEIAKLACLEAEFPLFMDELLLDARLPQVLLAIEDDAFDEEDFPNFPDELLSRAKSYVEGGVLPTDAMLGEEAGHEATAASEAEKRYSDQLLVYLRKTRSIDGPAHDLVYLASSAAGFGLSPRIAETIEELAVNGDVDDTLAQLEQLDADALQNALRLITRVVGDDDTIGIERDNALAVLLAATDATERIDPNVASDAADAIARFSEHLELDGDQLRQALSLARRAPVGNARKAIAQRVFAAEAAKTDQALARACCEAASEFELDRSSAAGVIVANVLLTHDDPSSAFVDGDAQAVRNLLVASRASVTTTFKRYASERGTAKSELAKLPATPETPQHIELQKQIDGAGSRLVDMTGRLQTVGVALRDHGNAGAAIDVVVLLLSYALTEGRNAAIEILDGMTIAEPAAGRRIVNAASHRKVHDQSRWLRSLAPDAVADDSGREGLGKIVSGLWKAGSDTSSSGWMATAGEVARLSGGWEPDLRDAFQDAVSERLNDADDCEERAHVYERLAQFVEARLIGAEEASGLIVDDLAQEIGPRSSEPAEAEAVGEFLANELRTRLPAEADLERVQSIELALDEQEWVSANFVLRMKLVAALARTRLGASVPRAVVTALATEAIEEGVSGDAFVSEWLITFSPTPADVMTVLGCRSAWWTSSTLLDGFDRYAANGTNATVTGLFELIAPGFVRGDIPLSVLRAAHPHEARAARATEVIVEAYKLVRDSNQEQRARVLELWGEAAPSSRANKQTLIDEVLLPIARSSKGDLANVLSRLGLVKDHAGRKQAIVDTLRAGAKGDGNLEKRVQRVLERESFVRPSLVGRLRRPPRD